MEPHVYTATVAWHADGDFAADAYSRGHVWSFDGGITVPASASPLVVGARAVEAAVDPEEAFVAALSSCHMLWFLDLARRAELAVAAYRDAATGEMRRIETGRWGIVRVTLRPDVVFAGAVPDAALLEDLHARAHRRCFIANSVTSEIAIEPAPARALDGTA